MPRTLLLISGLPAAGKSTLARRLADDLGWVRVSRDDLSTRVLEDLRPLMRDGMIEQFLTAKDNLVEVVVETVLDTGTGVVLDGNFNVVRHAESTRELIARRGLRCLEICLWGDHDVLRRRFVERADPPLTPDLSDYFEQVLHREHWTVLPDEEPIFQFDTTDIGAFARLYPAVLAAVRVAVEDPGQLRHVSKGVVGSGQCDECGFNWELSTAGIQEELTTLASAFETCLTSFLRDEDPEAVVRHRPSPDTWSAIEYAAHMRDMTGFYGQRFRHILAEDRPRLVQGGSLTTRVDDGEYAEADLAATLVSLRAEADAVQGVIDGLDQLDWWRTGIGSDGTDRSLISLARRLAHESHHHRLDVGRVLRAARGR